jgi:hypothetical protein
MKTQHLTLLIIITSAVMCIITGLFVLLWHAFEAAKVRSNAISPELAGNNLLQWNEAASLTLLKQKTLSRISQIFSGGFSSEAGRNDVLPIIDPVDGTPFEKGDGIIRCACGTNYHQHSWQWLEEKVDGRCVNCKRIAVQQAI